MIASGAGRCTTEAGGHQRRGVGLLPDRVPGHTRSLSHPASHSPALHRGTAPRGRQTWRQASSTETPRPPSPQRPNSSTFRVQLIQPTDVDHSEDCDRLLVYLPGTDGTGQAILPQIPVLRGMGYDVWCLHVPPDDRSDWEQLTTQVTLLLRQLLSTWRGGHSQAPSYASASSSESGPQPPRITIVAESFGCCLALRLAASGAGPELLDRLVLLNPATSFNRSLSGLSSLIAASNLLSLFPRDWYAVAQTTLLPLLVDGGRVEPANQALLQSMILMEPPPSSQSFGFGVTAPAASAAAAAAAAAAAEAEAARGDAEPSSAYDRNGSSNAWGDVGGAGGGGYSAGSGSESDSDTGTRPGSRSGYGYRGGSGYSGASSSGGGNGGGNGTLYYGPAAAANFRTNLLRNGDPGDAELARVGTPVLLVTSARDRLLPSIAEGARLERALPNARRHILPDSGHAAMLERGFNLANVMRTTGFAGPTVEPLPPAAAVGSGTGSAVAERRRRRAAAAAPAEAAAGTGMAAVPAAAAGVEEMATAAGPAAPWPAAPVVMSAEAAFAAVADAPSTSGNGAGGAHTNSWASAAMAAVTAAMGGGNSDGAAATGVGGGSNGHGGGEGEGSADTDSAFDEWCQNLAPWRDLVSPVVLGFEHLPPPGSPDFARPMLFVGNHQKMGFYDTPLLVYELYVRGYRVRGLAHPGHWSGPFGKWFESFGAVKASPMAAFRLLRNAEKVLLFPGGAKEVVKKRGQEYTLLWKESPDFVRLAARCNALIVPFAAVGADDAYDVIMDTDEVIAHPVLGPLTLGLLKRVSSALNPAESIFPITRLPGLGIPTPIPVPNLQRLYFQFSPPVDPCALGTDIHDPQQVQALYDGVRHTVEECMSDLLAVRELDEESQVGTRLARSLRRMAPVLGAAVAPPPSPPPLP